MSAQQDINQCIQQCQQAASQLRNMANAESDTKAKMALTEGAHHLDLCITECQFAAQNA
ncbi:MAG TPA: hypothetical protein VHS59_09350 [Bacillota bacterium]|nr:hypothetical protein [Bacillota bacterium]